MSAELHRLDVATEACLEQVSSSIAELSAALDKRKAQLLEQVTQASQAKRTVLEEQLALVAGEKQKVRPRSWRDSLALARRPFRAHEGPMGELPRPMPCSLPFYY